MSAPVYASTTLRVHTLLLSSRTGATYALPNSIVGQRGERRSTGREERQADRIKFKIATMTHKAIGLHTGNRPPYLANLLQWHTPSRTLRSASANLLSVTRCNISFCARGFRSAAPAIWNSLPSNVRSCETLATFRRHLKSHLFHSAFATA